MSRWRVDHGFRLRGVYYHKLEGKIICEFINLPHSASTVKSIE